MSSPVEFIVDFEDPDLDINVFGYQLGQTVDELSLIINVYLANRSWYIC